MHRRLQVIAQENNNLNELKNYCLTISKQDFIDKHIVNFNQGYSSYYKLILNSKEFTCPDLAGLQFNNCSDYSNCKECWLDSIRTLTFKDELEDFKETPSTIPTLSEEELEALPILMELAKTYMLDLYDRKSCLYESQGAETNIDNQFRKHKENIDAINKFYSKGYQGIIAVGLNILNKINNQKGV